MIIFSDGAGASVFLDVKMVNYKSVKTMIKAHLKTRERDRKSF